MHRGQLFSWYPSDEVIKGLTRILDDLSEGKQDSRTLHTAGQREKYVHSLPKSVLPRPAEKLQEALPLSSLAQTTVGRAKKGSTKKKGSGQRQKDPADRAYLVPRTCSLKIPVARISVIYKELQDARLEDFRNLCAVGLRVFLELSVDHLLIVNSVMTEAETRNQPLAKRMKKAAAFLRKEGKMPASLETVIQKVADSGRDGLAASIPTFNGYVHNKHFRPKPRDLIHSWDELEDFLKLLWPA